MASLHPPVTEQPQSLLAPSVADPARGWVLGPVGMLLSIPLTIMLKIALENQDETRWIGIMLGAGKRLDAELDSPGDP